MINFLILLLCLSFFNSFLTFLCLCILIFNRFTVMSKSKQNVLLIEEMKKYIKEYFKEEGIKREVGFHYDSEKENKS